MKQNTETVDAEDNCESENYRLVTVNNSKFNSGKLILVNEKVDQTNLMTGACKTFTIFLGL